MPKFLLKIARIVIGLTFIFSGFVKLVDPVGTGLVISEYLRALHLSFLDFSSIYMGIGLSVIEFVVGISIFLRLRIKIMSWIALCLISFFTLLTLYLAIFNPIHDCGCFGEAVHLSNWQTFFKNILLLLCIIPVFLYRKKFPPFTSPLAERFFLYTYIILAFATSIFSYIRMPFLEFTDFKVGSNIINRLEESHEMGDVQTLFIYEKGVERREFTLDALPDSTWNFVDSRNEGEEIGGRSFNLFKKAKRPVFDFAIKDSEGFYMTDSLIHSSKPLFFVVITNPKKYEKSDIWSKMETLSDSVKFYGGEFIVLTTAPIHYLTESRLDFLYSDYKTLITLHRANGGVVYINEGLVVKKWHSINPLPTSFKSLIETDYEYIQSKETIKQQMIYEGSLLTVILSIILMRYFCSIFYRGKHHRKDGTLECGK